MTVVHLEKNIDRASLTIASEYAASPEQVFELWSNPRLLEQWWGPPTYPATVVSHDFTPGGIVQYFMTGPEGDKHHGGWRVIAVDPPKRLELEDFFADQAGEQDTSLPVSTFIVTIEETSPGRTRMSIESQYPSPEALQQVIEMGMEEGIRAALSQTNALLVGLDS